MLDAACSSRKCHLVNFARPLGVEYSKPPFRPHLLSPNSKPIGRPKGSKNRMSSSARPSPSLLSSNLATPSSLAPSVTTRAGKVVKEKINWEPAPAPASVTRRARGPTLEAATQSMRKRSDNHLVVKKRESQQYHAVDTFIN